MSLLYLRLSGALGPEKPISLQSVRDQIESAGAFDRVLVEINSRGGCPLEAFRIYDALMALPVPVATTGQIVESAALVVFMAGSLRRAEADSSFLLHPARTGTPLAAGMTADDLRCQAERLSDLDCRIADLLALRTGYARAWFVGEAETEDTLAPSELVMTGIAHEVAGLTGPCDPAWPEFAAQLIETRQVYLPPYQTSQNYFAACRAAACLRSSESGLQMKQCSIANVVRGVPKSDALIAGERERAEHAQRASELVHRLADVDNRLTFSSFSVLTADQRKALENECAQINVELAEANRRIGELRAAIAKEMPAYSEAVQAALAQRRRTSLEKMIASLEDYAASAAEHDQIVAQLNTVGVPAKAMPRLTLEPLLKFAEDALCKKSPRAAPESNLAR